MTQPRRLATSISPLIIIAGAIVALYFAREVLVPLTLALTLTFLLTPAIYLFERLRLGRIGSVLLTLILTFGLLGGTTWIVATQLLDVTNDLPKYRENIHNKIQALHAPSGGLIGKTSASLKQIEKELAAPVTGDAPVQPGIDPNAAPRRVKPGRLPAPPTGPVPVQIVDAPSNNLADLRNLLTPILKPMAQTLIVLVFTIFMLIKREDLRDRLLRLVGLGQLNVATLALDDAASRVSRYLVMQFLVNAMFGALFGIGLYLIGVPNATLWGVIAAILRIIPYVGTLTAMAMPLVLSLAVFDGWQQPLLVLVLFAMLEITIANFIEPWLYGAHTGISSLALLVTAIFWTVLWGWAGLVLSTPLTVCVIVLGRYVPQLSFLHILLGDEAALSSEAQFYQRLLAMDQNEARVVAERFVKGRTVVELYDGVVLPALSMAEQDRHKGALDETREAFFFLSVNELIAEMAEYKEEIDPSLTSLTTAKAALRLNGPTTCRVICVPANDEADEIAASMLAQALERAGCIALAFPLSESALDSVLQLQPGQSDIICISSVPPFAFSNARSLCRRVRARIPDAHIVVGLWGFAGDLEKTQQRFGSAAPEKVLTTLASTSDWIVNWQTPTDAKLTENAILESKGA